MPRDSCPICSNPSNLRVVNTEQNFDQAFKQLCSFVEPTVLLVRHGGSPNATEVQKQIVDELKATKDFKELNVFNLIKEEQERHTEIGREINE
jgi:hypothetical protein